MNDFYKYSLSVFKHPDTMAVEYGRINFSAMVAKIINHFFLRILGVCLILASALSAFSQEHHIYPPTASFVTTVINANNLGEVNPGDVIFIHAGNYHQILVQNIHGAPGQPVRLINIGGVVNVGSEGSYYGISFRNCRYIEISGSGEGESNYGFVIAGIRGAGLSFGHLSSHVSASHIHIHNTSLAGIMAKSDLDCTMSSSRDNFLMKNIVLHSNWLHDIGMEGMYIGSTFYHDPRSILCGDSLIQAYTHLIDGVWIYNNIFERIGRNAIQASSTVSSCHIYDNRIFYDSQAVTANQMGGIIIGGGSTCNCYNNRIAHGRGTSIQVFGKGEMLIYNNIIEYPGRSIDGGSPSQSPQHGIYIQSKSDDEDVYLKIFNNTIVSPISRGIWFHNSRANSSMVKNNLVIDPGSSTIVGSKAFVDADFSLDQSHNLFFTTIEDADFMDAEQGDYRMNPGSPLIDRGADLSKYGVTFDFNYNPRPMGFTFDVGAIEFEQDEVPNPVRFIEVFPNPAAGDFRILFFNTSEKSATAVVEIFDSQGQLQSAQTFTDIFEGRNVLSKQTHMLRPGMYILRLKFANATYVEKLLIQNRFAE